MSDETKPPPIIDDAAPQLGEPNTTKSAGKDPTSSLSDELQTVELIEEQVAEIADEAASDMSASEAESLSEAELMQWRYRLLPTMQRILYIVTAIFFISGLAQLGYLQWSILQGAQIDRQAFPEISLQIADSPESSLLDAAKFEAAVILESYVLERRYHQANTALMTMAWIRYLGFSKGMILAIVGTSFILGMLREKQTDLSAEGAGWGFTLRSSSPGLVMVVMGVILMFATIAIRQEFSLKDLPTYYYYADTFPTISSESDFEAVPTLPPFVED